MLRLLETDAAEAVQEMAREVEGAVVFDVQVMQLTLMAAHPQALKQEVAEMGDVVEMFGDVAMQACLTDPVQEVVREGAKAFGILEQVMPEYSRKYGQPDRKSVV